jgi:hypothetical protein
LQFCSPSQEKRAELLPNYGLQTRVSGCDWETPNANKTRENRSVRIGQVQLAIRATSPRLGQAKDAPNFKAYHEAEEKWVMISASDTIFSRFFERRLAIFLRPMMRGGFGECNDIFSQKLFLK